MHPPVRVKPDSPMHHEARKEHRSRPRDRSLSFFHGSFFPLFPFPFPFFLFFFFLFSFFLFFLFFLFSFFSPFHSLPFWTQETFLRFRQGRPSLSPQRNIDQVYTCRALDSHIRYVSQELKVVTNQSPPLYQSNSPNDGSCTRHLLVIATLLTVKRSLNINRRRIVCKTGKCNGYLLCELSTYLILF